MALYVSAKKARVFPVIIRAFRRLGRLSFHRRLKSGAAVVAGRVPPAGAAVPKLNGQVNIQGITGTTRAVPATTKANGRK